MMKYLIPILFLLLSCSDIKKTSKEEISIHGDSILYQDQYVTRYINSEWEFYRGKKIQEISVERIDGGLDTMTNSIMDFLRSKHPKAKIEVKID